MHRLDSLSFPHVSAVIRSFALGATVAALAGCGGPPVVGGQPLDAGPARPDTAVQDVAAWFPGNYSSAAQAAADNAYFDVRLHVVGIWPDRVDGAWLYVEQAMADAQDKPYRQRIYRIVSVPGDRAEAIVYELPGDPLAWRGAWNDPGRFNALDPGIIQARAGCSVILQRAGTGRMTGATLGADCGDALRGAKYATSEVYLSATALESWDRGFDAAGKQVWGPVKGPYRFIKESAAIGAPVPAAPIGDGTPVLGAKQVPPQHSPDAVPDAAPSVPPPSTTNP
jgi:hypothetical protein